MAADLSPIVAALAEPTNDELHVLIATANTGPRMAPGCRGSNALPIGNCTAAAKHVEDYEGVAYYFCCGGGLTTFRQDRAKYAAIYRTSAARSST